MMFNMSSVLASVGAGCDVRLSNMVTNQQLYCDSILDNRNLTKFENSKKRINHTYHGSTKHIRSFLPNLQCNDERINELEYMSSLSPQHFVQSTISSTSGISLTGPTSSLETQLTTPSSFAKISSISYADSAESNLNTSTTEHVFPLHKKHISSNVSSYTGYTSLPFSKLKPETNYGFQVYEEDNSYEIDESPHHDKESHLKIFSSDARLKNFNTSLIKPNEPFLSPLKDRRTNESLAIPVNTNHKKYSIDKSNHHNVSSPEYVNVPLKFPSSVKSHENPNNSFHHRHSASRSNELKNKTSNKNYIRKASPEVDEIGDSSEGDSSSYLSAISYQSRLEMTSEGLFNQRYDGIDGYNIKSPGNFSKPSTQNCSQL